MSKFIYLFIMTALITFTGCNGDKQTASSNDEIKHHTDTPVQNDDLKLSATLIAIPQNVTTNEDTPKSIKLQASGSEQENLKFIVSTAPLHGILTSNPPNITYIPNLDFNGEDSFMFEVITNDEKSSPAKVNIVVLPVNDAPIAVLKAKKGVVSIDKIAQNGFISGDRSYDNDGKVVSYKFYDNTRLIYDGNSSSPCINRPSCYQMNEGIHTISLVVVDNEGKESLNNARITLKVTKKEPPNIPPTLDVSKDKIVKVNTPVKLVAKADDSDGIIVSYKWMEDGKVIGSSSILDYTPTTVGEHKLTITVTDNRWATKSDEVMIKATIEDPVQNIAPLIHIGETKRAVVGESIALEANATDSDGEIVSYSWTQNGELLGNDKTLIYTPKSPGEQKISLSVIDDDNAVSSVEIIVIGISSLSECSATLETQANFTDTFVAQNHEDIDFFFSENRPMSVNDIAALFNYARSQDATISKPMKMPSQSKWDQMSESQKALFLINSERCARGIRAYEGISARLVTEVSQPYANLLANTQNDTFENPHEIDGRTPFERMEQDGGIEIDQNADFFQYAENIAFKEVVSYDAYPKIYAATAKSIYSWIYENKQKSYADRNFILAKELKENSGDISSEGLIAIGQAKINYTKQSDDGTLYLTKIVTVLNGFDPNENWDTSDVIKNDFSE